jgi:hypothetical protein
MKCSNPSHLNLTKATNAMERYERKNKGNPQRTLISRSSMFPSLRGEMDWWKYRSDLLSLFPQKDARIMGGIEEGGQVSKVKWRREGAQFVDCPRRKKGYLYPLQNLTVGATNTA